MVETAISPAKRPVMRPMRRANATTAMSFMLHSPMACRQLTLSICRQFGSTVVIPRPALRHA